MVDPIIVPTEGTPLIEGDSVGFELHTWMDAITDAVNDLVPLDGSGSPEGVEVASVGRFYIDTSFPAGDGIYYKETGDSDTGWVLRS